MKRLLIVDDEKIYQMMIAHAVKPLEFEVHVTDDGEKALQVANQNPPDVMIADVLMPKLNGYELTRRLRRDPRFAHIPIMILTAQADLNNKLEAFEAGADDFMSKPFEPAELVARLNVLLRRSEPVKIIEPAGQAVSRSKARFYAVHSLRGGVGCSSIAANLGVALTKAHSKTTLVLDLVLTAGQIALMFNMPLKRTWADIAHIRPDELDWEALQTIIGKHDSGVFVIAAPTFPTEAELLSPELLTSALQLLRSNFDYIVVDLPHDFSGPVIEVLDLAETILLLLAPEVASVRAAAAALDTYRRLEYPTEKIKAVLNWTFERRGIRRKNIEMALNHPIELVLPFASELFVEAINHGRPWVYERPDEKVSEELQLFTRQLLQPKTQPL
ncbi:MAG: response regulator [Anaerolineales bacterium]|nr:response regulator [Anaerolineales bacterium]